MLREMSIKRLLAVVLAAIMLIGLLPMLATTAKAANDDAYDHLITFVSDGKGCKYDNSTNTWVAVDDKYSENTYKIEGGGTLKYKNIIDSQNKTTALNEAALGKLTKDGKKKFLEDYFSSANAAAKIGFSDANPGQEVSEDTVKDLYNNLQNIEGMGTVLMASLLQNTKPDYAKANRIYEPFSGIVGTILGFLAIIVMALLGITMALDIVYITVPAAQLLFGEAKSGSQEANGVAKLGAKFISIEAQKAVQQSQEGSAGEYKSAIGSYFKMKWKGLMLLGICLLYLIQGQIYTFVAWFIDLLSGFIGF